MAVRIRLQRLGRKKRPFYRIVAADARAQRDGVFLERLGHYNPITEPADVVIDEENTLKWLRRGAQPTDTAKRLLSQKGIWKKFTFEKLGKSLPEEEEETVDMTENGEEPASESAEVVLLSEEVVETSEDTIESGEEPASESAEVVLLSEEVVETSADTTENGEETASESAEVVFLSEEVVESSEEE